MQLQFEPTWNKSISQQDRTLIEQTFTICDKNEPFTLIRQAINHRGEHLLTVLVHNQEDSMMTFQQRPVQIASFHGIFTIPQLQIPPYTSMPWTFIFKKVS